MDDINKRIEAINKILTDNFYGYNPSCKSESVAKAILMMVSAEIKALPIREGKCENFPAIFLERLMRIYFALANGHYIYAGNEISVYIDYYPIDGRRAKNALVSTLEKFGF